MRETKGLLLKTYLENHKQKVDGNTSVHASTHQHANQNSNEGYREGKHERSKKTKYSYISYICICIKTDVFEDISRNITKSVMSHKKRLQTIYQH